MDITFTTAMLGTKPSPDVFTEYVAGKEGVVPTPEELATIETVSDKGQTRFAKIDNRPILNGYMLRGFLCEAATALNSNTDLGSKSDKAKENKLPLNLKSKVDSNVFMLDEFIPVNVVEIESNSAEGQAFDISNGYFRRIVRGQTMQGPRTALVASEIVGPGSSISTRVGLLVGGPINEFVLRELLNYGKLSGIGQFRRGSFGRFRAVLTPLGVLDLETGEVSV